MKKNQRYVFIIVAILIALFAMIMLSGVFNPNSRFIGEWTQTEDLPPMLFDHPSTMEAPETHYIFNSDGSFEIRHEYITVPSFSVYGTYDVFSSSQVMFTAEDVSVVFSYVFSNHNYILTLTYEDDELVLYKVN